MESLFDAMDVAVTISDEQGHFIIFNKAMERLSGYTHEEASSGDFLRKIHPKEEQYQRAMDDIDVITHDKGSIRSERYLYAKDGAVRHVVITSARVEQEGKKTYFTIYHDVSEARNRESQLMTLIETIPDLVYLKDGKMRNRIVNKAFLDTMGLTREQVYGKTDREIFPPGLADHCETSDAQAIAAKGPLLFVEEQGDDAPVFETIKAPVLGEDGSVQGIIGVSRDITERRHIERSLRRQLDLQRAVADISSSYLHIANFTQATQNALGLLGEMTGVSRTYIFEDVDGGGATKNTYEWCNDGIEPQKENLQHVPYELIPSWRTMLKEEGMIRAESLEGLPEDILAILEPQNIKSIIIFPIIVNDRFNGFMGFDECREHRQWNDWEVLLLQTASRIIASAYERWHDSKEQQKTLRCLEVALKHERQAEKMKTQFLSITSHELRTPLTPMQSELELILRKVYGQVSDKQRDSLEIILRNTKRLNRLIGDILDISKLESGNMQFFMDTADLYQAIKDAMSTLRPMAVDQGVTLTYDGKESFKPIVMDAQRIVQVITNLVKNAVKFAPEGSTVIIKAVEGKRFVQISVADQGIGIAQKDIKRIFAPFVQVDSELNRKFNGSGLGLAICKRIVVAHGGDIKVDSKEGEGSTFTFTIPYTGNKKTKMPSLI